MADITPARRAFLKFMTAIALLHIGAIALYYAIDIPKAAPTVQRYFAWTWIALTVVVVFAGIQRLKRLRRR
jgi:hypothetical protein